jgi:transglutaminase-like putative cysteine protease
MGRWRSAAISTTLGFLFKGVALVLALATPLLGVWCASSLAAYLNGPIWLALLVGALLFPILPVAWDIGGARRARKRPGLDEPRKRILTGSDRLILRTLAVNVTFLVVLIAWYPKVAFAALSTRGDWMLEGNQSHRAGRMRRVLFATANGLEWLYVATHRNQFRDLVKSDDAPKPEPTSASTGGSKTPSPAGGSTGGSGENRDEAARPASTRSEGLAWPVEATLQASVQQIPPEAERSIETVGSYIASREPDPVLRVKALHDYVADRVRYDVESYRAGVYPPQDAETVFRTRKSVCAGYAELLAALGKAAQTEIAIVVGDARTRTSGLTGEGHAWNAARIAGRWYLIDATWDSGFVNGATFTKAFKTDYFLTPPDVFGTDHFPEEPSWQLREAPLSRGDFLRQPALRPAFFAQGLKLVQPTRSQVTVSGSIDVELANPRGVWLSGVFGPGQRDRCRFDQGAASRLHCEFPIAGEYALKLFTNESEFGTYEYAGVLEINDAR